MKKVFAVLALVACSLQITQAQIKGQLTALEEVGDGSVFQRYWGITKKGDQYTGTADKEPRQIKFKNNVNNKFSSFELHHKDGFTGRDQKPNHYTEPSFFWDNGTAFLYINGLLYCLEKVSNPSAIDNIRIEYIYVLIKPAKGEHTMGKAALKELKNRDHHAVIRQYLDDMKVVQEKATANFTDEIKAEIQAVEDKILADKAALKAGNDAYWQTEEGKRVAARMNNPNKGADKVTIKNTGTRGLTIVKDSGITSHINGGSSSQYSCKENYYYAIRDKNGSYTKGQLISGANNNCGSTVSAPGAD